MKNLIFSIWVLAILTLVACKQQVESESDQDPKSVVVELPDYTAFNQKVETLRSFIKSHSDEDLNALKELLADTLKWSPPAYNGNQILGKKDYLAVLEGYHQKFENIKYDEGIVLGDIKEGGWWSGSAFPEESASSTPDAIRMYGTWTATHTESGKEIGVKWYAISWVNDAGKIAQMTEYFDVNGIAAQIAEE